MSKLHILSLSLILLLVLWPVTASAQTPDEVWRLGITVEGTVGYNAVIGRVASEATAFRSDRAVSDIFFVFPAPATQRTVESVQVYVLDRTGSYSGSASLALEVRDFAGTVQHTVSAASLDMASVSVGTWISVTLSTTPDDLIVSPGEYLVSHFELDNGSGGDLDVRPIFEIEVK